MTLAHSYLKVNYSLRPAKQVERRMLIDGFHLLSEAKILLRDYHYIGMGSIHFYDFSLFHKFLGIDNMTSVEISPNIPKRVQFNVPFQTTIKIKTNRAIGDEISTIRPSDDKKYVVWLDYDTVLSTDMLRDIQLAVTTLPMGSILLVTVDTEPPDRSSGNREDNTPENKRLSHNYFHEIAPDDVDHFFKEKDFRYEKLPGINTKLIECAIREGIRTRIDGEFLPLYNFIYADTHRMLTLGGIIASKADKVSIQKSRFAQMEYARFSFDEKPFLIRVPIITRKEHLYLESHMPCGPRWRPVDFEISVEDLKDYRKIYRYFPSYAELFL